MLQILKDVCEKREFISIYTNTDNTECFIYGKVLCFDDEFFAFGSVSPGGLYDGIAVKPIDCIFRIEKDDSYSFKMKKLMGVNQLNDSMFNLDFPTDNIIESVLTVAKKTGKIVSVALMDDLCYDVIGTVVALDEGICTVKQIDNNGRDDGISYFKMDDITEISFDSLDEQKLSALRSRDN